MSRGARYGYAWPPRGSLSVLVAEHALRLAAATLAAPNYYPAPTLTGGGRRGAKRRKPGREAAKVPLPAQVPNRVSLRFMTAESQREAWCWRDQRLKPNADAFKASLRSHFLQAFYHWAPTNSVRSILDYGLRSPAELRDLGLDHRRRGYGSYEKQAVLAGYVYLMVKPYLGLVSQRGMRESILLEIEPTAAWTAGAVYVPGNSARSSIRIADLLRLTEIHHFELLFGEPDAPVPLDYQAEILVPESVSAHFIRRITCSEPSIAARLVNECHDRLAEMPYPPQIDFAEDLGLSRANALSIDALF
jgi:hypothetical protein